MKKCDLKKIEELVSEYYVVYEDEFSENYEISQAAEAAILSIEDLCAEIRILRKENKKLKKTKKKV